MRGPWLEPALRAAFVRAVQANAGDAWSLVPEGLDHWVAVEDGASMTISRAGLELGELGASVRASGYGRRGSIRPLRPARIEVARNVASLEHAGLVERWAHGPLGLEHLLDVAERPAGVGELVIELELRGALRARAAPGVIELLDAVGRVRATYAEAFAADADGRALPIRLEAEGASIRIVLDDTAARYPVAIDPLLWVEQSALRASDGAAEDWFGYSVALSRDLALVGAPNDDVGANADQGTAYTFFRSGTTWTADARLVSPAGGRATERFGYSVALYERVALIGAIRAGGIADPRGAAFSFAFVGSGWSPGPTLAASDGEAYDGLGASVALTSAGTGLTAAVGAPMDDVGAAVDGGSVRIFVGDAYGTTWAEQATLVATDGAAGDQFGSSVSLAANRVAVGAPMDDVGAAADRGSLYVLSRTGTTWAQDARWSSSDGAAGDNFGISVSLDGDVLSAGASSAGAGQGRAYVYRRSGASWPEEAILVPADLAMNTTFGASVSLSGDLVLVGAATRIGPGMRFGQGGAYVFSRAAGGTWSQAALLLASDGGLGDHFGGAVALFGADALVGAYSDTLDIETERGSAYVGPLLPRNGEPCSTDADCAPGSCVDGVCCSSTCGGGLAGDCEACSIAAGGTRDGTCTALSPTAAPTVACHPSRGGCDPEELCVAGTTACPADVLYASGFVCRALAGTCDEIERCDGVDPACPVDVVRRVGDICALADAANLCDADDVCSGSSPVCPPRFAPGSTPCGPSVAGDCDSPDHCAGTSADCVAEFLSGVECRAASGACDAPELCLGDSPSCPSDVVEAAGMTCRGSTGACDPEESCDGASPACPLDVTTCGSPDGGTPDGGSSDAATIPDAGTPPAAVGSCGCALARPDALHPAGALSGLVLALFLRRRTQRNARGRPPAT